MYLLSYLLILCVADKGLITGRYGKRVKPYICMLHRKRKCKQGIDGKPVE